MPPKALYCFKDIGIGFKNPACSRQFENYLRCGGYRGKLNVPVCLERLLQASDEPLPDTPVPSQAGGAQSPAPAGRKQQNGAAPQQPGQQPAGTAAAGIENTAGVAASKPAGVAIAPPKQRRVRLLVVKVGAIVGAGAALGTVAALSKGSPRKPPGAH